MAAKPVATFVPRTSREERALTELRSRTGGMHVDSIATCLRISIPDARFTLASLAKRGDIEQFDTRGSKLWRIKTDAKSEPMFGEGVSK